MRPASTPAEAAALFAGSPLGLAVLERVLAVAGAHGPYELRVSRSQVALRRRRAFALLWRPGQYLRHPGAEVVLSVALPRRVDSPRWKQVVQPAPGRWVHHLEVHDVEEVDDEVAGWLRDAASSAG